MGDFSTTSPFILPPDYVFSSDYLGAIRDLVISRRLEESDLNHPKPGEAMDVKMAAWWLPIGCGLASLSAALLFAFVLGRALA
ncbi:hypothetical protein [Methylobacterium marchantiae]|uniref:Uncharacterized protein n=1 Tax=Methylobacterium marchantiae TaxID=600331 RepID=A0ABW3WVI9_9HYPH|nr:hypothetical protein AIGOOFII_1222 [Methylobacterium marchantiae]